MDFTQPTTLGRTGLKVGRLGIASGYWAPTEAIELAFERGCNYLTWGTFIRGRSPHLREAVRRIVANGQRDRLVLAMFSYAHQAFVTEKLFVRGLRALGIEQADVLVLGYFSKPPSRAVPGRRSPDEGEGPGAVHRAVRAQPETVRAASPRRRHRRLPHPVQRRQFRRGDRRVPGTGRRESARSRGLHRGSVGKAARSPEDAARRDSAVRGRRLPLRAQPPGGGRVHGRAEIGRTHARRTCSRSSRGPLDAVEMARMRRIGDHIYGKPR